MSGVSSKYKDLAKFTEYTESHLFGGGNRRLLKKAKERHYNLQAPNSKKNYSHPSAKQKFHELSRNHKPTKLKNQWLSTRVFHITIPQVHG